MDSFKEQIIRKRATGKDNAMRALIIIGTAVVAAGFMLVSMAFGLGSIGFCLGCGAFYGGYLLLQKFSIEYEYIFTNGDLDIDKIIGARSRKRLISVKVADATDIGELSSLDSDGRTIVLASANEPALADYFLDVKHKKHGDVRIIFTPNEDILRMMKPFLPRTVRGKLSISEKETSDEE